MDQLTVSGLEMRHSRDDLTSQNFSDTFFFWGGGVVSKIHNVICAVELQALHLRPV